MITKKQEKIIGHEVLSITLKEVIATNNITLAKEIERIFKNNQLPKPALHKRPNDISTSFYKIDLQAKQIEEVLDIFIELEAKFVNERGETTPIASLYASLVDSWNNLLQH